MVDKDSNFPLDEIDNKLVNFLQKIILFGVQILAILMTIVILWGVIDVGYILYEKAQTPPYLLNIEDILGTFGAFLVVLIAIEIFLNIVLYLKKDMVHLKLVIATALMAIARKVIILDYDHMEPAHIYAISAAIAALGFSYWLTNKTLRY